MTQLARASDQDLPAGPFPRRGIDLSQGAVVEHWREAGLLDIIQGMESCESWALDGRPRAETIIEDLCAALSDATTSAITVSVANRTHDTVELMAYLKSGRALLLFSWLAEVNPAVVGMLVRGVQDDVDEFGALMLDRVTVLERQRLLSRIFAPERLALVIEALENEGFTLEE